MKLFKWSRPTNFVMKLFKWSRPTNEAYGTIELDQTMYNRLYRKDKDRVVSSSSIKSDTVGFRENEKRVRIYSIINTLRGLLNDNYTEESVTALYSRVVSAKVSRVTLLEVDVSLRHYSNAYFSDNQQMKSFIKAPAKLLDMMPDDLAKEDSRAIRELCSKLEPRNNSWVHEYRRLISSGKFLRPYAFETSSLVGFEEKRDLFLSAKKAQPLIMKSFSRLCTRYTAIQMKEMLELICSLRLESSQMDALVEYFIDVELKLGNDERFATKVNCAPCKVFTDPALIHIYGPTQFKSLVDLFTSQDASFEVLGSLPSASEKFKAGKPILQCCDFQKKYVVVLTQNGVTSELDQVNFENAVEAQCAINDSFHDMGKYLPLDRVIALQKAICQIRVPVGDLPLFKEKVRYIRTKWSDSFVFKQQVLLDPMYLFKEEPVASWLRGSGIDSIRAEADALWPLLARGDVGPLAHFALSTGFSYLEYSSAASWDYENDRKCSCFKLGLSLGVLATFISAPWWAHGHVEGPQLLVRNFRKNMVLGWYIIHHHFLLRDEVGE